MRESALVKEENARVKEKESESRKEAGKLAENLREMSGKYEEARKGEKRLKRELKERMRKEEMKDQKVNNLVVKGNLINESPSRDKGQKSKLRVDFDIR